MLNLRYLSTVCCINNTVCLLRWVAQRTGPAQKQLIHVLLVLVQYSYSCD